MNMQFGNQGQGATNGYVKAVHTHLQSVLNQLVNQGIITQQNAHTVANSVNNWVDEFVQQYNGRTGVYEKDICADLFDAISARANVGGGNQMVYGNNQPMNQQAIANTLYANAQGGNGGNLYGNNGGGGNMYITNGGNQGGEARFDNGVTERVEPMGEVASGPVAAAPVQQFTEYDVPTTQPSESVLINTDETRVKVLRFPSNGSNVAFDDYRIRVAAPVASYSDIISIIQMSIGKTSVPYVATLQYKKTKILPIAADVFVEHLSAIQELFEGKSDFVFDDLIRIYKLIDGLPRNVYEEFASIIVELFNTALKSRTLHNKDFVGKISVASMENILAFNPAANDDRLTILTGNQFFERALNSIITQIINKLCSIELAPCLINVVTALRGTNGVVNLDTYAKVCSSSKVDEVLAEQTCIVYNEIVHVTNMDPAESKLLTDTDTAGHVTFDKAVAKFTSPLEYLITKLIDASGAGDKLLCASGEVYHYGYTCDSHLFVVSQ